MICLAWVIFKICYGMVIELILLCTAIQQERLKSLETEVQRLTVVESEGHLKDDIITQLHDEISNLQNFIRQLEVQCCYDCHEPIGGGSAKLLQLNPASSTDQQQVLC